MLNFDPKQRINFIELGKHAALGKKPFVSTINRI